MRRTLTMFAFLLCVGSVAVQADNGRTPIPFDSPVSFPITISESGSYVLTRNMTGISTQSMFIVDAPDVTIDLNGMVLTQPSSGSTIQVTADSGLRMFNGTVTGGQHAIMAAGAKSLDLDRVKVENTSAEGVLAVNVEQVNVTRSQFRNTADTAVRVDSLVVDSQAFISDNAFTNVAGAIGMLEVTSAEVSNNRVNGVTAGSLPGGIVLFLSNGVQLTENVVRNATNVSGIFVSVQSFAVTLQRNIIDNTSGASGIDFSGSAGLMHENVVTRSGVDGMTIGGSFNQIEANAITSNTGFGLHFTPAATNNVYRLNTSRGNNGNAGSCTGGTNEFCDEGGAGNLNTSQGDNQLPALF